MEVDFFFKACVYIDAMESIQKKLVETIKEVATANSS